MGLQKIYKIIVDDEEDRIVYEKDIESWYLFLENIKAKISKIFNISDDYIYIFGHNLAKLEAYFLIYNKKINNMSIISKDLNIKIIASSLLNNVILSTNIFNSEFSKDKNDWPRRNLIRGGRQYYPPYGWIGLGLNIKNKYETTNDNMDRKRE